MSGAKIIVVAGATGQQGGGLACAILNDKSGEFRLRAVTRDSDQDKAQRLREKGAEVVVADLDDVDSLKKAYEGAYGVFGVTNFWEHMDPEKELQQAKNIAEASRAMGVKHVVWSSLDDVRKLVPLHDNRIPTLHGKWKVPHYDAKGEADKFFVDVPTTFLKTVMFWENFMAFDAMKLKREGDKLLLQLPMGHARLPGICVDDIGKCALGIFKRGHEFIGKTVGIAGDILPVSEYASILSKVLHRAVEYRPLSIEEYRKQGFDGADDLANMFQFWSEFEKEHAGRRDVSLSRKLNPELLSFKQWAEKNAEHLASV